MARRDDRTAGATRFTVDQLQSDRARVVTAAKRQEGAIVVDKQGERRFSIWIPQGPISTDD